MSLWEADDIKDQGAGRNAGGPGPDAAREADAAGPLDPAAATAADAAVAAPDAARELDPAAATAADAAVAAPAPPRPAAATAADAAVAAPATPRELDPALTEDDLGLDRSLRPRFLADYVGQGKVKDNLHVLIEAARQRHETLDHLLFSGPPGLGKTTLASIVANEFGVPIRVTSGPAIERAGDLAAILTNLEPGEVLFIDEIHRLNRQIEEVLYPAMEDYALDIVIGKGPAAQSLRLEIPHFTLIGATTRTGLLTGPLRDRFGIVFRLDYYSDAELQEIVLRSARLLGVSIDVGGAGEIARRSRGTPRLANRLLKRVRDFAAVRANGEVDHAVAAAALAFFEVDELGLDAMDNRILHFLVETFSGRAVGLNTLANALGEEAETLEDVYEPYLLQQGLLVRTPKGRQATRRAFEHLGVPFDLFNA